MPPETPRTSRVRSLLHLVRVRGLRRTVRAVVQGYLLSFRRWYVFHRPIPAAPPPPPPSEFECRLVTAADLESFAVFEPNRQRREFREWLDGGALLFAAFVEGRPVAFQCFGHAVPVGPPLSSLALGPGQLWTIDVQTLPAYRRHSAASALRAQRDCVLAERGYREYVSSVQDDNLPALSYAYGGRQRLANRIELLTWVCVLGFRRIRVDPDAAARLERRLAAAGLLAQA